MSVSTVENDPRVLRRLAQVSLLFALASLLADSASLAPLALHSDIERGRLALAAFGAATKPLDRGSFVHYDGTLSIRRSYTAPELQAVVPHGWHARRQFPYRLLLIRDETLTPQG